LSARQSAADADRYNHGDSVYNRWKADRSRARPQWVESGRYDDLRLCRTLHSGLPQAYPFAVIYRVNYYRGGKLTGTQLVDARKVQEANQVARHAVNSGQAARAEVRYLTGGLAFGAGPKHPT